MKITVDLDDYLKHIFNYDTFHPGQREIIEDILDGHNVFGVLPTGSGKSLCYQLPAKIFQGKTIVISPLISLMIDQVKQLKSIQYKDVVALNSLLSWQERQITLKNLENYSLIYMSPELLQDDYVLRQLQMININLFVIDEAHCVSQWGHEFRTDYLRLPSVINRLGNPPTLALSATAPDFIQDETINLLNLKDVKKHIYPIDRPNISLSVEKVLDDNEKVDRIVQLLTYHHVPTIIYFLSRKRSEEIAAILATKLSHKKIAFYHGGMDSIDRISVQQQFMNDQIDIICCTSAFGMGINKHNIRLIIHFHLPVEIESFIQEIGRAGRDGSESASLAFYTEGDSYLPLNIIERQLPNEHEIDAVFTELYRIDSERDHLDNINIRLSELFQLSEAQVNFLVYQLEEHGIIKDKLIYYDKKKWQYTKNNIKQLKNERLVYKQTNLNEMITWLKTEECLRETLYLSFQHSYTKPSNQCCSNCGFSFDEWKPIEVEGVDVEILSWQGKLAQLLLIGDSDETRRHY